ncbi:hypothetical protein ACQJBY_013772 [Aegilops geniculata]
MVSTMAVGVQKRSWRRRERAPDRVNEGLHIERRKEVLGSFPFGLPQPNLLPFGLPQPDLLPFGLPQPDLLPFALPQPDLLPFIHPDSPSSSLRLYGREARR